jgi:hypothetical protein
MEATVIEQPTLEQEIVEEQKLPKNCKENRYYYRNREQILERKRQKRLEDPEYQAKQKAKEDAKKAKEEEKKQKMKEIAKEKSRERAKKKAELLGVLPVVSSGADKNTI